MPVPKKVDTVQRQLMREEVYTLIKKWIVEGELQPGEKVRDMELAETLGVSRMPVREALQRLADEGLVETSANRWTRVSSMDPGDAQRIYPILWSLEPLAVRLSAGHLGEDGIEAMRRANTRMARAIESGKPVEASREDAELHRVYLEATANPELIRIVSDLKLKLRRLEIAYFGGSVTAARSVEEHEELIRSLAGGDFDAAANAVRENWEESLDRMLKGQLSGLRGSAREEPAASGS